MYFDKRYGLRGSDEFNAKLRVKVVDKHSVRLEIRKKKARFTQQHKDNPTEYELRRMTKSSECCLIYSIYLLVSINSFFYRV